MHIFLLRSTFSTVSSRRFISFKLKQVHLNSCWEQGDSLIQVTFWRVFIHGWMNFALSCIISGTTCHSLHELNKWWVFGNPQGSKLIQVFREICILLVSWTILLYLMLIYFLIFGCVHCLYSPTASCTVGCIFKINICVKCFFAACCRLFSAQVTDLRELKTILLEIRPTGKHFWIMIAAWKVKMSDD